MGLSRGFGVWGRCPKTILHYTMHIPPLLRTLCVYMLYTICLYSPFLSPCLARWEERSSANKPLIRCHMLSSSKGGGEGGNK